jgi:hypothetical protein
MKIYINHKNLSKDKDNIKIYLLYLLYLHILIFLFYI